MHVYFFAKVERLLKIGTSGAARVREPLALPLSSFAVLASVTVSALRLGFPLEVVVVLVAKYIVTQHTKQNESRKQESMAPLFFSKLGAATATFAGHLMTVDYVGVTAVEVLTLIRQQREREKQAGGIAIPNEKAENKKDGGLLLSKAPKLKQNEVGRKGSETQTADDSARPQMQSPPLTGVLLSSTSKNSKRRPQIRLGPTTTLKRMSEFLETSTKSDTEPNEQHVEQLLPVSHLQLDAQAFFPADKCHSGWMDYINGDFWLGDLCDIPLLKVVSYWDSGRDVPIDTMQALVSELNPKNYKEMATYMDEFKVKKESQNCVTAIKKAKDLYKDRRSLDGKAKAHIQKNFGRSAHFSELKKQREDGTIGEETFEHHNVGERTDVEGIGEGNSVKDENLEWLCKLVCSEMQDSCVAYSYSRPEYTDRPQYCWIKSDKHKHTDAVMKQHIMSSTCVKRVDGCDDATIIDRSSGRLKNANEECEANVGIQHPEVPRAPIRKLGPPPTFNISPGLVPPAPTLTLAPTPPPLPTPPPPPTPAGEVVDGAETERDLAPAMCVCPNGTPVEDEKCPAKGTHKCSGCGDKYTLFEDRCRLTKCLNMLTSKQTPKPGIKINSESVANRCQKDDSDCYCRPMKKDVAPGPHGSDCQHMGSLCTTVHDSFSCLTTYSRCCIWTKRPMCRVKLVDYKTCHESKIGDEQCGTMLDPFTCRDSGKRLYKNKVGEFCCEWGDNRFNWSSYIGALSQTEADECNEEMNT